MTHWETEIRMAALRLRLQKEMFDVTEEQLLALAHVTNSQVNLNSFPVKKRR